MQTGSKPTDEYFALQCADVVKSFGGIPAVSGLSLSIKRGELYALLGPNGAGKTTFLRMVAGLTHPDYGNIRIGGALMGQEGAQARRSMAYLPEEPMLYGRLTPYEYLGFVATLWRLPPQAAKTRATEILHQFGLSSKATHYIETLSTGMKQKLALAGAIIHKPSLLLIDEPLTGLDVTSARLVKDYLISVAQQGGTVVLTTHLLDVAERLASRIGIMNYGKIIAEGTLQELKNKVGEDSATLEEVFIKLVEDTQ